MTEGTSQGLFIVVAIVIFGIFVSLSYTLFGKTLKPQVVSLFEKGTEQANYSLRQNILVTEYMYLYWNGTKQADKDYITKKDSLTYSASGLYYAGLVIMGKELLEPNKNYALSFRIIEESGEISSIGGHIDFSTETAVYLNGNKLDNSKYLKSSPFHEGIEITEKTNDILIYFNTNGFENDFYNENQGSLPSKNPIHIQPNRKYALEDGIQKVVGFNKPYTVTMDKVKVWVVK